ncbi:MAG: glycosyl transferase family 2 protein [Mucilaginibacter sp.]|uniref:glycosyltransferase family 2 protein n=1 Tax=Mucilaginibacter sp. TaxID=1882438 RepID=UPI00262C8AD7|nr:glycosyltransferase [Mucilaginibacter sp.]MDB5002309.1 glycosyl transferase family 2 protein [Mucilaginibacter sp.]
MIQLSIVICTLKISNLRPLLKSLNINSNNYKDFEIIIINQSGESINDIINKYTFNFIEVVPKTRLSAPNARNYGAEHSNAEYVLFMDDDAIFVNMNQGMFKQLIEKLTQSQYSMYIVQRGEVINNKYITHWPNLDNITIRNFSRFVIEWNFIIRRSLFGQIGGFYDIGPGSKHLAQAGEAFILGARVLVLGLEIHKLDNILIAHPSLFQIDTEKNRKYVYGTGYAVGYSIHFMPARDKVYWITRTLLSSIFKINFLLYKLTGFFDGLKHSPPRSDLFNTNKY